MQHKSTPDAFTLEQLLALRATGPQRYAADAHQTNRNGVLHGGQLVAQVLSAALATAGDRRPHALHLTFQSPGTAEAPVHYEVESTRDGGNLSTRRVVGRQAGAQLTFAIASFKRAHGGYRHQQPWRDAPPPPETLASLPELEARYADRVSAHGHGRLRSYPQVEVLPIDPEQHLLLIPGEPRCRFWIRAKLPAGSSLMRRHAALAYLSDYLLVNAALVPHAGELPPRRLFVASLNHAIWFHDDGVEPSDWLLYETYSPWAGDGHVLCQGRLYSRDGQLLASTAQEAMVRPLAEVGVSASASARGQP